MEVIITSRNVCEFMEKKEDMNKSKNENALEVKIKKIFAKLGVKSEIVNLNKLGGYDNFKAHPDMPRLF